MDELYGLAEHEDFMMGAEDMEHRARRIRAEAEADLEAAMEEVPDIDLLSEEEDDIYDYTDESDRE
jgi:hypothetical protein